MAPVFIFIVVLLIAVLIAVVRLIEKVNEMIETGLHDTLNMEITDDDIRKIVQLVLEEMDKR